MGQVSSPLRDPAFWTGRAPGFPLAGTTAQSAVFLTDETAAGVSDQFHEDGYFKLETGVPLDQVRAVRSLMDGLVADGLPVVFIYLYDAPWALFRGMHPLLSRFLGDRVALLPHFWSWYLPCDSSGAGWPPHRDYQGDSMAAPDLPISLSLWVPLGAATPENGCMYLLPRSLENQYEQPVSDPSEVRLQDVRALPAAPGAVMGWRQDVYHWGARASRWASEPRVSLSLEFQNPAFDPLAAQLLDLSDPPRFDALLPLLAGQILTYGHMQAMTERDVSIARFLTERQ